MAANERQLPGFGSFADIDLGAPHIQNDGRARLQFFGQSQDFANWRREYDQV
jgi:hypothetical protein